MQVNVMRVTPHHALQLTCCRMQLFELSLSLCLHGCYMKREPARYIRVLICVECVSRLVENIIETLEMN